MIKILLTGCLVISILTGEAQRLVSPGIHVTKKRWSARWISPKENAFEYGVIHFRKSFILNVKPAQFIIHISADNRYRLFVNGKYVNDGPQISDSHHWRFESLDIAPLLIEGKNVVAVQVVNYAEFAPVYIMGKRAALIVQGDDDNSSALNTDSSWMYHINKSISPIVFNPGDLAVSKQYYAAGPMEKINAEDYPWGWETLEFNDQTWNVSQATETGAPFGVTGYGDATWDLLARSIPLNEYTLQQAGVIRRTEGLNKQSVKFPIQIPANTSCSILLDQQQLTNAFPQLVVSGGKNSEIKLTYAEALFEDIRNKGHRDSIEGKSIRGVFDVYVADGGNKRTFTSVTYRTFRYLQLDIKTESQPLMLDQFSSWFTAYPFEKKANFLSSDPSLSKIFDIGWRTARLCAYETYMDCPYWERLQYIGDTRIQALVSYYVSGDDRLARNALEQFYWSMEYDGLTYSRYPSSLPQYIPNYSLVWVTMIHDFFMYRNDPEFVKSFLPGMQRVLNHFQQYVTDDYMMKEQPYWDFFDHTFPTHQIAEESYFKKLTTNSLFYAYTLSLASEIFNYYQEDVLAQKYFTLSQNIKASVKRQCYDSKRRIYADTPDKKHFSMHSNIMAVLCDLVPDDEQKFFIRRITEMSDLTPTTLYFDFYLARAMNKAGAGDQYMDLLVKWKSLLMLGLTTFPEGVDRSECHAWSASPNFEMIATFAGIQPIVAGFKKVLIKPQLQKLDKVKASLPHWAGNLEVNLDKKGTGLTGIVILPKEITGRLEWNGKLIELKPGENKINVM